MGLFRRRPEPFENLLETIAAADPAELRAALFASSSQIQDWATVSSGGMTSARVPVNLDSLISIPGASAAIRLLAETISMLPLNVYKGRGADKLLADWTWQHKLLAELPGMGDFTPADLISDIVSCQEWEGNAFVKKVKAPGPADRMPEVIGLIVIDPTRVRIKRERGEKVFYVREEDEKGAFRERPYTQADILHIRGWTPAGSDRGYSPMWMHRDKISSILAQNMAQGKFFSNGMLKNLGLEYPGKLDEQQAERLHQAIRNQIGLGNSYYPFVAQGGAKIIPTGMTMRESQFVEGDRQNMIAVAHMFRIPPSFLVPDAAGGGEQSFEQDNLRFYTLGIAPRLRRIEMALFTDADLFPQRVIYPEFDTALLMRTDAKTQAEVEHNQVQSGIRMRDEIRADHGWSALPDGAGKVVPETPTGAGKPAGPQQEQQPPEQMPAEQPANAPAAG